MEVFSGVYQIQSSPTNNIDSMDNRITPLRGPVGIHETERYARNCLPLPKKCLSMCVILRWNARETIGTYAGKKY